MINGDESSDDRDEDETYGYEHITTSADVDVYIASNEVFEGLLREIRELSKKKPEATMSSGKVKIVNRILEDLLTFLSREPEGKYLDKLGDDTLPQMSDAVLVMVQFETALAAFVHRYWKGDYGEYYWITREYIEKLKTSEEEEGEED